MNIQTNLENEKENNISINSIEEHQQLTKSNIINTNDTFELASFPDSLPEYSFKKINEKELNNLKCIYCDQIPLIPKVLIQNNHIISKNNKIVCNKCYSRLQKNEISFKGKIIDQNSSNILKQIIYNLDISCINDSDCEWEGKVSQLKKHLQTECEYQLIKCPNKECKSIFLKKDLNNHLIECIYSENSSKTICKYCHKEIYKNNIETHLKICPEMLINCINNCGKKFKRKDLENHVMICPENDTKCKYSEFGCNKYIKRKNLESHYITEIYNHYNLVNNAIKNVLDENNEYYYLLNIINELKSQIDKKENEEKENLKQIRLKEEFDNDPITFEWNLKAKKQVEKRKKLEKYRYYNDYIPFTGNPTKFISKKDSIDKKIVIFQREKILYSGNYFGNIEQGKYYYAISQDNLDSNSNTHFSFKIEKDPSSDRLPWLAFGLYNNINNNFYNLNYFPKNGFYCIDLESNTYYNGETSYSEENDERIDVNTVITISYLPDDKYLIIKDNNEFEIKFPDIPNINSKLRLCFIFKGKDRACIAYNY